MRIFTRYADACLWLLGIIFIFSATFKWIGIRSFAMTMEQFCDFLGYSPLKVMRSCIKKDSCRTCMLG